ncbi:hypothetical protein EVAR_59510_1 [Eumeta japonica]|uniref:Uncharacterized protein n=1 Tax=Eumeta variegata TaxID=151549 RepID=A0A4C1XUT9_EUMVA|nr:hypothetical protein EVAR_59510_1 [Eumeta japonica]
MLPTCNDDRIIESFILEPKRNYAVGWDYNNHYYYYKLKLIPQTDANDFDSAQKLPALGETQAFARRASDEPELLENNLHKILSKRSGLRARPPRKATVRCGRVFGGARRAILLQFAPVEPEKARASRRARGGFVYGRRSPAPEPEI